MQSLQLCIITAFLSLSVIIHGVQGGAMVSGSVFCDQCKDGKISLFDYPLSGVKVRLVCPGSGGQMTTVGEKTTDMLGNYVMTFDGTPDFSSCYTQISETNTQESSKGCQVISGPPKTVRLTFNIFDISTYTVDPLISQPANPLSFCPKSSSSSSPPTPPSSPTPPTPPAVVTPVNPPTAPKSSPTPTIALPPLPPLPFIQASACPYQYWTMKEYKCYWRAMNPDTKVALVFGPLAAKKYGPDLTLRTGLQGKGDPYKTLLRESITALLNSYNSFHYSYNSLEVLLHFNAALTASTPSVLLTALHFKRANSGHGRVPCNFTPCK